jgi:two-component system response regulator FlrC
VKQNLDQQPLLLWLDPENKLSEHQHQALSLAGWQIKVIHTLDDLTHCAPQAQSLALRIVSDIDRLLAVQETLASITTPLEVICRVDRQQLELGVAAAQAGARKVISSDDWRESSWSDLLPPILSNPEAPLPKPKSVVFVDPASQHLLALAQRVAQAEVTALLVGPTGAGKEVLARVLHEYSPRAKGPFVAMNCAAMPDHLIEDMLFGHEKGAFTGAHKDHKGLFEQAQGGTLFLDEIGEMPMHLQSKLLRVLQEKQLTRLGGQHVIHLNVRIVAATNKDLKEAIENKEFREDLYYRIATFRMRLLPLRERPGDIIPLALQCLQHQKSQLWQIDADAQSLLLEYSWPGNVRELENVMRRAMVLCPNHVIEAAHLMFDDWVCSPASLPAPRPTAMDPRSEPIEPLHHWSGNSEFKEQSAESSLPDLQSATRINEHQVIMATLAQSNNREEAAKRLGISPRTLRYKLAQFKALGLGMAA